MIAMEDVHQSKINWSASLKALWFLFAPEKGVMVLLVLLGILSAAANALVPLISGWFFDALASAAAGLVSVIAVMVTFGMWLCVQVVANTTDWYRDDRFDRIDEKTRLRIQQEGFARLLLLPISFHKNEKISSATETINKASWMSVAMMRTLLNVLPQLLSVIIGIIIAFQIHVQLAWLLVAGALVYALLAWRMARNIPELFDRWQRRWSDAWQDAHAAVEHVHAVKAFATEKYERKSLTARLWVIFSA